MHKNTYQQLAILNNLAGKHLPPVVLNIHADYQYCVDAGVIAAAGFFDDLTACGLHDHIAISSHFFLQNIRRVLVAQGDLRPFNPQAFMDAFAAGYLGRIQQELRLFHGEETHHASGHQDNAENREVSTWQTH